MPHDPSGLCLSTGDLECLSRALTSRSAGVPGSLGSSVPPAGRWWWMYGRTDGRQMDGRMADAWTDGCMDRCMDGWTDRWMVDGWTDGRCMDGWIMGDGWMAEWMWRCTDGWTGG